MRYFYHYNKRADTIQVYAQNFRGGFLVVGEGDRRSRTVDQAVLDIIARNVPQLRKFPKDFVPPRHATLSEDRATLRYSSGFSCNYPAYLNFPGTGDVEPRLTTIQLPS